MPIADSAHVDPHASIDPTASIGPNVVIDGPVRIGPHCHIAASAVILGQTDIGAHSRVHSHAVIGDLPQDRAYAGGESFCTIGEECTIREGATIHRGTAPGSATVVGNRCLLMTNVHVGHNCNLADDVTMVSGSLLGGYVDIGARAVISGNAAIHQFVRIGEMALVSILARVSQDVPPFAMTDREGAMVGVNRVGLARAKMSGVERLEICALYRVILQNRLSQNAATEYLQATVSTDAGRRLLEFMEARSLRGVTTRSRRSRPAA